MYKLLFVVLGSLVIAAIYQPLILLVFLGLFLVIAAATEVPKKNKKNKKNKKK